MPKKSKQTHTGISSACVSVVVSKAKRSRTERFIHELAVLTHSATVVERLYTNFLTSGTRHSSRIHFHNIIIIVCLVRQCVCVCVRPAHSHCVCNHIICMSAWFSVIHLKMCSVFFRGRLSHSQHRPLSLCLALYLSALSLHGCVHFYIRIKFEVVLR